jgi:hypothetical protein
MTTRHALLNAREHMHEVIRASEEWQPSYKKDRVTFAMLLKQEAQLNTATSEYLLGLSQRAPQFVDWSRVPAPIQATNDPVANNDDQAWTDEMAILTAAVADIIVQLATTGTLAGEALYGIPMAGTLDEAILTYARTHTAQLVSQVTETSRSLIRESIKQSIAAGEDIQKATARLAKVINSPVRAEMIAQTESVNAYQGGLATFAKTTGAKTKTWDGLVGACEICAPLIGKTIAIDKTFTLPTGGEVAQPAAHPRCRCGLIYNY